MVEFQLSRVQLLVIVSIMVALLALSMSLMLTALALLFARQTVSKPIGLSSALFSASNKSYRAMAANSCVRLDGSMQYPHGGTRVPVTEAICALSNGTIGVVSGSTFSLLQKG